MPAAVQSTKSKSKSTPVDTKVSSKSKITPKEESDDEDDVEEVEEVDDESADEEDVEEVDDESADEDEESVDDVVDSLKEEEVATEKKKRTRAPKKEQSIIPVLKVVAPPKYITINTKTLIKVIDSSASKAVTGLNAINTLKTTHQMLYTALTKPMKEFIKTIEDSFEYITNKAYIVNSSADHAKELREIKQADKPKSENKSGFFAPVFITKEIEKLAKAYNAIVNSSKFKNSEIYTSVNEAYKKDYIKAKLTDESKLKTVYKLDLSQWTTGSACNRNSIVSLIWDYAKVSGCRVLKVPNTEDGKPGKLPKGMTIDSTLKTIFGTKSTCIAECIATGDFNVDYNKIQGIVADVVGKDRPVVTEEIVIRTITV